MQIYEKINFILEKFLSDKNAPAKSWEIGTNFYNSLKALIYHIRKAKLNEENFLIIKSAYPRGFDIGKERFKIFLNGNEKYNVTPTTKKNGAAAKSTIRQYIQIWMALGIVHEQKEIKIVDDEKIELLESINDFIKYSEDEILEKFIRMISSSLFSTKSFIKNLGFTLFICLIDEYGEQNKINYFDKLEDIKFDQVRSQAKWMQYAPFSFNKPETQQYIKHVKGVKTNLFGTGKQTYLMLCQEIAKKYYFDDLVNSIYDVACDEINENEVFNIALKQERDQKAIHDKIVQIINQIKVERSKLRQNIINERVNCFGSKDNNYYDITNSKSNCCDVSYMDACHIYDVEHIIKDLRAYFNEKINSISQFSHQDVMDKIENFKQCASDYNNGIFMSKSCHDLFDKRLIWFSSDGKLNYLKEKEEDVIRYFGKNCENITIAEHALTQKMKDFLSKRKTFKHQRHF